MTRYSWVPPENKLDPEQRAALQMILNTKKNVWIRGFAGSGKSILLVHAMRHLRKAPPEKHLGFIVYTRALVHMFEAGLGEGYNGIGVETIYQFKNDHATLDVGLIDEIQDFKHGWLKILTQQCRRVIAAGDEAQSIFKDRVTPEEIKDVIEPVNIHLKIVHRITRSIFEIAKEFGSLVEPGRGSGETRDVKVRLWKAPDRAREIRFVWEAAADIAAGANSVAVLVPKREMIVEFCNRALHLNGKPPWTITLDNYRKEDFLKLNEHLANQGMQLQVIVGRAGDLNNPEDGKVRISTFHSAKGLDFNTVFLPFLDHDAPIFKDKAKTLFFVALTRSRLNLHLSYSSPHGPHAFVKKVEDRLLSESIDQQSEPSGKDEFNDDFDDFLF